MDSFADLAWTTPAAQPATLGAQQRQQQSLRQPSMGQPPTGSRSTDTFSLLAASSGPSRSPHTLPTNRTPSPLPNNATLKTTSSSSNDAFSTLVAFGSRTASSGALSLAERQKLAEKANISKNFSAEVKQKLPGQAEIWDHLDLVAGLSSQPSRPTVPSTSLNPSDPWDLDPLVGPTVSSTQSTDPFDLADLGTSQKRSKNYPHQPKQVEDDILGLLAQPVETLAPRSRTPLEDTSPRVQHNETFSTPAFRASSPPPHIVGQIVEMGFSVHQARTALAATDSGVDVSSALEMLLAAAPDGPADVDNEEASRREREEVERRNRRRAGPSRHTVSERSTSLRSAPRDSETTTATSSLQPDTLLAQASEIGLTVLSKANMFWKEGKERVQKVYEETVASANASGSTTPVEGRKGGLDGRPRWMVEALEANNSNEGTFQDLESPVAPSSSFRDDDDHVPPQPSARQERRAAPASTKPVSLLSDGAPTGYISPARHRSAKNVSQSTPPPPPVSRPRTPRSKISCPPTLFAESNAKKLKGTESFKLGQFAIAEEQYTAALNVLPAGFMGRSVLLSNRAASRVKTGDMSGAIADCEACLELIGIEMDDDDAAEGLEGISIWELRVKVLSRRAGALEAIEKWDKARADWERLIALRAVGRVRDEAVNGAARCRKMIQGNSKVTSPRIQQRPAPRVAKSMVSNSKPNEAVARLRSSNDAQEAEDQKKHELKDSVDAQMLAWKAGKEGNLRALIASLDMVLWEGIGWTKVGMHELVTPPQVKVRYTRAIAKVHPDKLNAGNTTVEQRMIANGVFAALNEAWLAFKQ